MEVKLRFESEEDRGFVSVYGGGERVLDVERRGEYVTVADSLGDVVFEDMVKYALMLSDV
jgi:hypothetical protein